MPALLPLLAIFAVFAFIGAHSALFPEKPPKKSAAHRYGESFEELLGGINKCCAKKDK